jgi:hypothetical protein
MRSALVLCVVAALPAIIVSVAAAPNSRAPIVAVPFAGFCLVEAALLAVRRPWTDAWFAVVVPVGLVVIGFLVWFFLSLAQVSEMKPALIALGWGLVLWLINWYCRRVGTPA